jgi:PLP dependent protein
VAVTTDETQREHLSASLTRVRARIAAAAERVGRDPAHVRLVAVSKQHPPELVRAAHALGLRDFGENHVQALARKAAVLGDLPGLRWHMVGHLQRNKAKDVARVAHAVHSLDSVRVAEALARRTDQGRPLEVLIQVNVGGETQKSGCAPVELDALVAAVRALPSLHLTGLMTVPPHTDDPDGARPFFKALASMAGRHGLPELSMGMTHDLEVAVEEGATVVRIGTALFGARPNPPGPAPSPGGPPPPPHS